MKKLFKSIISDRLTLWGFSLNFVFFFFSLIFIGIVYKKLPPFLPLYNTMPWGYARLGTTSEIFIPLFIVFLVSLGNLFFSAWVYKTVPLLARLICATSFAVTTLTCIFIIKVVLLVI